MHARRHQARQLEAGIFLAIVFHHAARQPGFLL